MSPLGRGLRAGQTAGACGKWGRLGATEAAFESPGFSRGWHVRPTGKNRNPAIAGKTDRATAAGCAAPYVVDVSQSARQLLIEPACAGVRGRHYVGSASRRSANGPTVLGRRTGHAGQRARLIRDRLSHPVLAAIRRGHRKSKERRRQPDGHTGGGGRTVEASQEIDAVREGLLPPALPARGGRHDDDARRAESESPAISCRRAGHAVKRGDSRRESLCGPAFAAVGRGYDSPGLGCRRARRPAVLRRRARHTAQAADASREASGRPHVASVGRGDETGVVLA